jgi:hypothetical protein
MKHDLAVPDMVPDQVPGGCRDCMYYAKVVCPECGKPLCRDCAHEHTQGHRCQKVGVTP